MGKGAAQASGTPNEAGEVSSKPGVLNVVAPQAGYSDEPPRMIVALHDSPRDMPDHTVYLKDGNAVHEADKVEAAPIGEVLDWVRKGLGVDLSTLWDGQQSQTTLWSDDGSPDETWARRFSERYFGITYGGPGQAYFGSGTWDPYVFSRAQYQARDITCIERTYPKNGKWVKERRGAEQVGSWQSPEAITPVAAKQGQSIFGDFEPNDDPAIAIIGACQQTCTYGAVTRGFFVEDHLSYNGYAASENSQGLAVFGAPGIWIGGQFLHVSPQGKFYALGTTLKNGATIARTTAGGLVWEGARKKGVALGLGTFDDSDPDAPPPPSSSPKPAAAAGSSGSSPPPSATPTTYVTFSDLRHIDYATDPANLDPVIGTGTIVTYNPHGFIMRVEGLYLYAYERENWSAQTKVRATVCRELHGDPSLAPTSVYADPSRQCPDIPQYVPPSKTRKGQDIPADEWAEMDQKLSAQHDRWVADKAAGAPRKTSLDLPKTVQDPGSHITFILRVSKDTDPKKKRIQMFDTGNVINYWILEAEGKRGLIVRPMAAGIFDGCAIPSRVNPQRDRIPEMSSPTTGIGVLPAPSADDQTKAVAALEKARPIGLCRLVITLRRVPPDKGVKKPQAAQAKKSGGLDLGGDLDAGHAMWGYGPRRDDVLYMSRLLRMYGDDPTQNYYLSKLVWSLRNTPYFTNVQPWWFVFAPKGVLAKSMWATDGRTMTMKAFTDTVLPLYVDKTPPKKGGSGNPFRNAKFLRHVSHYQLTHVITNCGSDMPDRAGRAYFWCRSRSSLSDAGSTSAAYEGWRPPGELMKLINGWPATDDYKHAGIDGDVIPSGGGGGPPEAAWDWFQKG